MRKTVICFFAFCCFLLPVHAESYCVMSGNDGGVSEEKDMHKAQSVASISKIMTSVVALEKGRLEDEWQVSDAILKADGSSLYLKVGDTVSLKSMLYGLMLRSGNDAAVEIAQHIGGSQEAFVTFMNEKAKELGMQDTEFHNPSGLDEADGGNISSAYDMALLMRYAMKNTEFAQIVGTQYYDNENNVRWKNKNKLLFTYAQTTGGKTGFTKKAGRTLVSSAAKDDLQSIVVTLGMGDDFSFHEGQHEKQFQEYTSYVVLKAGNYMIHSYLFQIPESLILSLHKDGGDHVEVQTALKDGILTITITRNESTQIYTYEGTKK